MPKKLICALGLVLLSISCTKEDKGSQQARFYENGKAKPIVALVPIINSARADLPWNLSDELTAQIHYRLMQKDKLYLVDEEKIGTVVKRIKEANNPFDTDLSWIKKIFFEDEYVVFMELITHEALPVTTNEGVAESDSPTELNMKVRVRVIDVRGEQPKIVLQEILQDSHVIPKQFNNEHFQQVQWGKDNYEISPLGIAHTQLSKMVASRLEDYILLSMSDLHE